MPDLKLGRLPDRTPVKITFLASPELAGALHYYTQFYNEKYSADEPITELIPYMLQEYLGADRGFAKALREKRDETLSEAGKDNVTRRRRSPPPESPSTAS